MKYDVFCKKVSLSDSSKEKILKKVEKLDKFFTGDTECRIVVSKQKERMIVEITFPYKGFIIRAEGENGDLLTAVDACLEGIDRQIRKNKTKLAKRLRSTELEDYSIPFDFEVKEEPEEEEFQVIKVKKIGVKPMNVEEAILQMNMLGHDFFVFQDGDTMAVNIVYRRRDGNYALIETEA